METERKGQKMRLNVQKVRNIMQEKNLTEEMLCTRTGLYPRSLQWILDKGCVSEEAIERIADAVGIEVKEITLPDASVVNENVIEFITDSSRATVTFSQRRYKTRILKLAERRPGECEIVAVNAGGSICAHIPVSWIKIAPPKTVSENQRVQACKNFSKIEVQAMK